MPYQVQTFRDKPLANIAVNCILSFTFNHFVSLIIYSYKQKKQERLLPMKYIDARLLQNSEEVQQTLPEK